MSSLSIPHTAHTHLLDPITLPPPTRDVHTMSTLMPPSSLPTCTLPTVAEEDPSGPPATSPPLEFSLAQQVLHTTCHAVSSTQTTTTTPADRGYARRPKKGKPIPKGPLRARIQGTCGVVVAIVGPDYVGITTLLRLLEKQGHAPTFLATKPAPHLRGTFQYQYLEALIAAW